MITMAQRRLYYAEMLLCMAAPHKVCVSEALSHLASVNDSTPPGKIRVHVSERYNIPISLYYHTIRSNKICKHIRDLGIKRNEKNPRHKGRARDALADYN